MIKLVRKFLLFSTLCLVAAHPAQAAENFVAANLAQNGSFENGAAFWSLPQKSVAIDIREAHLGTSSLRLATADPKSDKAASQFIPASPGDVLAATVWVKAKEVTSATIALEAYAADGTRIGGAHSAAVSGTFDWKPASVNYTVPPNADKVFLRLSSGEQATGVAWFDDVEVKIRPVVLTGVNVLQEADFEGGLDAWNIPQDFVPLLQKDAAIKHSGAASLRGSNDNPEVYLSIAQKLPALSPGDVVHLSGWVKGENVNSTVKNQGAGIYLEFYDSDNKWLAGSYPKRIEGTFDWTQVSGKLVVPAKVARAIFGIYMRQKTIGTAWFDDVELQVEPQAALHVSFQYPNYRGPLTTVSAKPWQALVEVHTASGWASKTTPAESSVFDASGKLISQTTLRVPTSQGKHEITIPPPANLAAGAYYWRLAFTDPVGKVQRFHQPIQLATQAPTVALDAAGFTVVDGKRFFPLGLYLGTTADADLQRIAAAGFNTVLSYNYGFAKDYAEYLDRAQAHNLKVIFSLKDMHLPRPNLDKAALEKLVSDRVVQLRSKPALLAWYINDELPVAHLATLEAMYGAVKALDPNHPTYQVLGETRYVGYYDASNDIIGTDPYPVGKTDDLHLTTQWTQETLTDTHGAKGVWMVPQIMDWAVSDDKIASHPPSLDEMRNQSYQAIIGGAQGLIFYSYFNLWFADSTHQPSEAAFEKRWPDVAGMAKEINALSPALLEGTPVPFAIAPNARVTAKMLKFKNQLLVLVANPYPTSESLALEIPAGWKPKQPAQSGVTGVLRATTLTLSLPALGSGAFVLEPA